MDNPKELNISDLPDDILVHIFLLLPLESILACKLLSNKFKELITGPEFSKHYNNHTFFPLFSCKDKLYYFLTTADHNISSTVERSHCQTPFTVQRVPIDIRRGIWSEDDSRHRLLSWSFHGVACVRDGEFLIYNLLTGASFTVKNAPCKRKFRLRWICYGFGYDREANDYKIMVVCKVGKTNFVQNEHHSKFWVYSFRNRVWKPFVGFPYALYNWHRPQACTFNGVLHWVASTKENPKWVIVTYDLHTCRFGRILFDECVGDFGFFGNNARRYHVPRVGVFDGKLCCLLLRSNNKVELWVMEKYGVRESWKTWISLIGTNIVDKWKSLIPTRLYEYQNGGKGVLFVSHNDGSLHWYDGERNIQGIGEAYLEEAGAIQDRI